MKLIIRLNVIEILSQNPFDLKIYIDKLTCNYSLIFEFIDSEIALKLETGKNEDNYPPLKKLKDNQIKFITTGIWKGESPQGRACEYNVQLLRLGQLNIGDSFKQAKELQFITGREREPSAVVLIYEDYDHIFNTEADEAYNELINMTKGNPTLEISLNNNLINLKIWDILIDLEIKFNGFKYSQEQLSQFLQQTNVNSSFVFALGFPPIGKEMALFASTKREGFEIITLRGYSYKKSNF